MKLKIFILTAVLAYSGIHACVNERNMRPLPYWEWNTYSWDTAREFFDQHIKPRAHELTCEEVVTIFDFAPHVPSKPALVAYSLFYIHRARGWQNIPQAELQEAAQVVNYLRLNTRRPEGLIPATLVHQWWVLFSHGYSQARLQEHNDVVRLTVRDDYRNVSEREQMFACKFFLAMGEKPDAGHVQIALRCSSHEKARLLVAYGAPVMSQAS